MAVTAGSRRGCRRRGALGAVAVLALASTAQAAGFVNGGFEDGNLNGWTSGNGYRGNVLNNALVPTDFLPGGSKYNANLAHSQVISSSYVDPMVGAALGSTVHSGNHALRAQDTNTGGYASVITQTVNGYTDPNIYFAWKAVLLDWLPWSHTFGGNHNLNMVLVAGVP